ncbi:MAG: YgiQ family radical SAM protein [Desulfamplus sp.]|nr:YgiQ family radical SAM protein [Desulfamplus sp.]
MFLPTTPKELSYLGWHHLDVILVTGDAYIDSPFTGVAVIGKLLVKNGFRVGIIAQPDINSDKDITRLGEPTLFWGITSGSVDSMVSNYTALKKRRKSDDYTPGGINNRRPDRALIAYTNLVKRYFKNTCPIVLGGIEASLRRVCHYDFWSDTIRRSILFDAKADYLVYGMAESTVLEFAKLLKESQLNRTPLSDIRGLCYISDTPSPPTISNQKANSGYLTLPPYEVVKHDKARFAESFHTFYKNNDPLTAHGLIQKQDTRYLIHNPPALYPDTQEMDNIAALDFERDAHPYYKQFGKVKALDTIQFSISTHRGCYGECNFCSIAIHEGRTVRWRSEESIANEVKSLTRHPEFKGIISDVGGPTANMYGFECEKKLENGSCPEKRCLFPTICKSLKPDHSKQVSVLRKIRQINGVRKVFVASGIRYDLVFSDKKHGNKYLEAIVKDHVSGQLKVAPEHTLPRLLELMGKSDSNSLLEFKKRFDTLSQTSDKRQFMTYYLMAAHPGCTLSDMEQLRHFTREKLNMIPEQIQIFTPTPSSYSTLMYYTRTCPFSGNRLFVEKSVKGKEEQKKMVTTKHKYIHIKKNLSIKTKKR